MTPTKAIAAPKPAADWPDWVKKLPLETLGQLAVPLGVLAIVIALITPLPGFLIDERKDVRIA
jgi:flagellar biosynthesis component FlhA